jgi:hypothetical protein
MGSCQIKAYLFGSEIQSVIQTNEVPKGFAHHYPQDVGHHFQRIEYMDDNGYFLRKGMMIF